MQFLFHHYAGSCRGPLKRWAYAFGLLASFAGRRAPSWQVRLSDGAFCEFCEAASRVAELDGVDALQPVMARALEVINVNVFDDFEARALSHLIEATFTREDLPGDVPMASVHGMIGRMPLFETADMIGLPRAAVDARLGEWAARPFRRPPQWPAVASDEAARRLENVVMLVPDVLAEPKVASPLDAVLLREVRAVNSAIRRLAEVVARARERVARGAELDADALALLNATVPASLATVAGIAQTRLPRLTTLLIQRRGFLADWLAAGQPPAAIDAHLVGDWAAFLAGFAAQFGHAELVLEFEPRDVHPPEGFLLRRLGVVGAAFQGQKLARVGPEAPLCTMCPAVAVRAPRPSRARPPVMLRVPLLTEVGGPPVAWFRARAVSADVGVLAVARAALVCNLSEQAV
jgi:hypothetical protein